MTLQPLADYVLIEAETRVQSAQRELNKFLPDFELADPKFQGAPEIGKIRYLGADVTGVKVGDRVRFHFAGERGFEWQGEKFLRVKAEDLLAVIED